jgi:hypothetical protein
MAEFALRLELARTVVRTADILVREGLFGDEEEEEV